MNATDFMSSLIADASKKKSETGSCYAFAHGEFNGKKVTVRLMDVRTNSKTQTNRNWKVNGKPVAAAKVSQIIS